MYRVIRFLAVIALALSPVWGVPSVDAMSSPAPAHYPVWPSSLYNGCSVIPGPGVSATVTCSPGGFLLTQFNSGYACNEVDIFVNSLTGGPFLAVGTVNSGSVSNSVQITDAGNWYIQFPLSLAINVITFQITAQGNGGSMDMGIVSVPCNVPTDSPTVNPSFTPTVTRTPSLTPVGSTYTLTPVPTFTPLPSGHNTFTRTPTPGPGTNTAIPTNTATPGPSENNCGDSTFPVLNCLFQNPGTFGDSTNPDHWLNNSNNASIYACGNVFSNGFLYMNVSNHTFLCKQVVTAHLTGTVVMQYKFNYYERSNGDRFGLGQTGMTVTESNLNTSSCPTSGGTFCTISLGAVANGVSYDFGPIAFTGNSLENQSQLQIQNVWVSASGDTRTPVPATGTATNTVTVTPTPVPGTATNTPIPIPGAMSTNIPTATECPGGCAVAALTSIPGLSTRVTVDTSPFSPLTNLSLARSTCAPFGFALIPIPHIIGTPALGSTTPLSYTWTVPITANWDDSHPMSNTAIQPCAMVNEIPPFIWDFTYWLSVLGLAVGWFLWLIGFVGRLSGEETING